MNRTVITFFCLIFVCFTYAQQPPKREFRGTWIHTVWNQDYRNMTTPEMQQHFCNLLDTFAIAGINVVVFQVRPQADAFYLSEIEPWSRFITGIQGQAPEPVWDPLEFLIEECHQRGMELHAWFNPYRVKVTDTEELCHDHLYYAKPYLFLPYGRQIFFDPGHPESREHTLRVIADVVTRYDIDAVHFDDYFYPYKLQYEEFPDEESFMNYHKIDGFGRFEKNNWRRNNVNILIRDLNITIKEIKPWVKFGVSPFGVWRNKATDPTGSETRALSNYDELYADIKLWVENGWIDYNVPQLYWTIGNPAADYEILIKWWSENNFGQQLYIGQDIGRTVNIKKDDGTVENQLYRKMQMVRENPNVHGNIWWSGYNLSRNPGGIIDSLSIDYQRYPSLLPLYKHIDSIPPAPVKNLKAKKLKDGSVGLSWTVQPAKDEMDKAAYFCVYRFEANEKIDLEDATKILKIARNNYYIAPAPEGKQRYKYVVTAIDRLHNESAPGKELLVK